MTSNLSYSSCLYHFQDDQLSVGPEYRIQVCFLRRTITYSQSLMHNVVFRAGMSELISPGDYFDRVNRAVEAVTSGKLSVAEASRTFNVLKATVQYKVQQQSKLSSTPIVSPSNPATEDVKTSRSVPMRSKAIGKRPATNNLTTNETPKTKLKKMIKTQTPEEEQNDSEEKPIESNVFISVDKKPNRITTRTSNRQIKAEVVEQTSAPVTNGSDKPLTEAQLQSPVQPNNFPMLSSKKIPRKSGAKPPVVEKDNNDNQQDFDKNVPGDNFSVKISAETVVASLATLDVGNDSETKDDQNLHGGPQIKLPKTGKDPTSMLNDYLQRQSTLSSLSALTGAPRLKSPVKVTPARTAKSDQKKFHSGVEVQLKVTVDQLCAKCSRIQKENIVVSR